MSLTLIGTSASRALRPLWLLEELDLDFEHQPHRPHAEAVRAVTPTGKVPVLLDGGHAIADSVAALSYLADRHGRLTAPAGSLARAEQDAAMLWALGELDGFLWTAARHSFVLPKDRRLPEIKDSLKWEVARSLDILAKRLEGRAYVAGDAFSIADIVTAHCLAWAGLAKFPLGPPVLQDYAARMLARPAAQRARARP